MTAQLDEYQLSQRKLREAVQNKAYRAYPIGQEAAAYLRANRGNLSEATYRTYESCLDKLARHFPDLELRDLEPPVGAERIEEFLDYQWGERAPGTYNTNFRILGAFFKWCARRGRIQGNPMLLLDPHRAGDTHREIFSKQDRLRIIADGPDPDHARRDRILLQLLLKYGLRKGGLRNIQFKHFDANRRILTVFTKGSKVRQLPITDAWLWDDLEKLQFEISAEPHHYLLSSRRRFKGFVGYDEQTGVAKTVWREVMYPEKKFSDCGTHNWWYGCLERAGVVAKGVRKGDKIHKARHTAGQRLLDRTGNIKAVQTMLMHESPATTMKHYVSWDVQQLAAQLEGDDE